MTFQVFPSGRADVDGLLWGSSWDRLNLTYSFPTKVSDWPYGSGLVGFSPFTTVQMAFALRAMKNVDAVCGLVITKAAVPADGNLRWGQTDQVNYFNGDGLHVPGGTNQSAEATPPSPEFPNYAQGDLWFTKDKYKNPTIGTFAYAAGILHELGHAVGLKHGQVSQTNNAYFTSVTYPALPIKHDGQEYSVMTYNLFEGTQPNGSFFNLDFPTTLMQNDIAALQYMYGADFTSNAGNTVYKWSTTGEMFINNNVSQGKTFHSKIFLTIWDGGGTDTYDFSNYTTSVVANLNPGQWSTPNSAQKAFLGAGHYARGSIANALLFNGDPRSLIENAKGGSNADNITGNVANNAIDGMAGNDKLAGSLGNDTLTGGLGNDTLTGGAGVDRLVGSGGADKFVFSAGLTTGRDVVVDFNVAADTIMLENAVFAALGGPKPAMASAQFFRGSAAHDANDRVIYKPTTGELIYDMNGNAAGAAFVVALLPKNLAVTYLDFEII